MSRDMFGNDLTKTDSFGTPREVNPCEACLAVGWLLMDNDEHGLRIERCDSCKMFASDDEAVTFVAEQARKALDHA